MFCIQKGSPGAAVPIVTGAEHCEPRAETSVTEEERRVVAPKRTFERARRMLREGCGAGGKGEAGPKGVAVAPCLRLFVRRSEVEREEDERKSKKGDWKKERGGGGATVFWYL